MLRDVFFFGFAIPKLCDVLRKIFRSIIIGPGLTFRAPFIASLCTSAIVISQRTERNFFELAFPRRFLSMTWQPLRFIVHRTSVILILQCAGDVFSFRLAISKLCDVIRMIFFNDHHQPWFDIFCVISCFFPMYFCNCNIATY